MQVLYSINRKEQVSAAAGLQYYDRLIESSFNLYVYNLLVFLRVAEYARQVEIRKRDKLRPTEADKAFTAKLANNEMIQSLSKNFALTQAINKAKLTQKIDPDTIRRLYSEFAKKEAYEKYLMAAEVSDADQIDLFLQLYKFLINEETFTDMVQDHFPLWSVDKSLVVGAMKKTIKAFPAAEDFLDNYRPDDETVKEFGLTLLKKVLDADEELLGIIEPTLKNWDAERVAILDMIILKMAISEFLHFPTIPTKVTLNEFVEVAKVYSTDKSKDFINGILDRLLKQLTDKGMITKQGRGLKE